MILVSRCRPCGAPWPGGRACQMISDDSARELFDFAEVIRFPLAWFHIGPGGVPHFELSPDWRKKALAAGAKSADSGEFLEGANRWRQRNPR